VRIGVLALQGDFAEHLSMLRQLEVDAVEVRLPEHLAGLDGLIIPGGESTTIGKLATDLNDRALRRFGQRGRSGTVQERFSCRKISIDLSRCWA
jgi:5'-phosphate synthase pdxT subunit